MTTTLNTDTIRECAGWVFDPGHEWLEVTGSLMALARECATGYDYATRGAVYLEGDVSAHVFVLALGLTPETWPQLREREFSPRHLPSLAAGSRGVEFMERTFH